MTMNGTNAGWRRILARCGWIAGFLLVRTHYFLTVIVGPFFGWR